MWIEYVVDILSCLVIVIPLVYNLVKYVRLAIKEKNWKKLVDVV